MCVHMYACVYVYLREREKDKGRERERVVISIHSVVEVQNMLFKLMHEFFLILIRRNTTGPRSA